MLTVDIYSYLYVPFMYLQHHLELLLSAVQVEDAVFLLCIRINKITPFLIKVVGRMLVYKQ
jgi:hypothetical protein